MFRYLIFILVMGNFAHAQGGHAPGYVMDKLSLITIKKVDPDFLKRNFLGIEFNSRSVYQVGAPEVRRIERALSDHFKSEFKVYAAHSDGSGNYWIRFKNYRGQFVLQKFGIENGKVLRAGSRWADYENPEQVGTDPRNDVYINGTTIIPTRVEGVTEEAAR